MSRIPIFGPIRTAKQCENIENPSLIFEKDFACRRMTYPSGSVTSHKTHKKFAQLLQFIPEKLQHTQKRKNKMKLSVVSNIEKS